VSNADAQDIFSTYQRAQEFFEAGNFKVASQTITGVSKRYKQIGKVVDTIGFKSVKNTVCIVSYRKNLDTGKLIKNISDLFRSEEFSLCLVSNADHDVFPELDVKLFPRVRRIIAGFNYGASVGRNLAIVNSSCENILFLDDDGLTNSCEVRELIRIKEAYSAIAVRGKVVPLSNLTHVPKHYDLGENIIARFMDIEGFTAWDWKSISTELFNPLLFGHEGVELSYRLYKKHGPNAFLYAPNAILHHDFVEPADRSALARKLRRMGNNEKYIESLHEYYSEFKRVFYNLKSNVGNSIALKCRKQIASSAVPFSREGSMTLVTTCFNGEEFIERYVQSILKQTFQEFQVVFVDDGSEDNSVSKLKNQVKNDNRFKIISTDKVGRSEALNIARDEVDTEFVAIADVDDISIPTRIEWNLKAFQYYPDSDAIGFNIFDFKNAYRSARPIFYSPIHFSVRRFFGMPSPFPGFSFRNKRFPEKFDKTIQAGVDCDWIHRNFHIHQLKGVARPEAVTYYHVHDGQISANKREIQKKISLETTIAYHEMVMARELNEKERNSLECFLGWKTLPRGRDLEMTKEYSSLLIENIPDHFPERDMLLSCIIEHTLDRERAKNQELLNWNRTKLSELSSKKLGGFSSKFFSKKVLKLFK